MQTPTQDAKPKLTESSRWLARARTVIPGCAQTFSKAPAMFVQGIAPNFLSHGDGACVWDVDGNRYIDYISGLGPNILGYANGAVNEAVYEQMRKGVSFSLPHTIEVEVAELLRELIPCAEMVRFGKNGSDATSGAVRLARVHGTRPRFLLWLPRMARLVHRNNVAQPGRAGGCAPVDHSVSI